MFVAVVVAVAVAAAAAVVVFVVVVGRVARLPPRRVQRFQGCDVLNLEIWHMDVWDKKPVLCISFDFRAALCQNSTFRKWQNLTSIYSHPWPLRSRFLHATRLPSSLDLLCLRFHAGVVLRQRRKYRGFRCCYQEPRQLQIQSCVPKADCLDCSDDDGDDDDDAPDYDDFCKYDDHDVDVVACSCGG